LSAAIVDNSFTEPTHPGISILRIVNQGGFQAANTAVLIWLFCDQMVAASLMRGANKSHLNVTIIEMRAS
jgi:hypothetical protein